MRRVAIVAVGVAASALVGWGALKALGDGQAPAKRPGVVRVIRGKRVLLSLPARTIAGLTPAQLYDRLAVLPAVRRSRRGRALIIYRTERGSLGRRVAGAARFWARRHVQAFSATMLPSK